MAHDEHEPVFWLGEEARPIPEVLPDTRIARTWQRPTLAQEQGIERIQAAVQELATRAPRLPDGDRHHGTLRPGEGLADRLASIDRYRPSTVFLIEGSRGSGKTTVMLTLLERWRLALESTDRLEKQARSKALAIPLPILDLEPLPRAAELPAVLLARFQGLYSWASRDGSGTPAAWMPGNTAGPALERAWDRIRASVSAWSGPAAARKLMLEREVYARELLDDSFLAPGLNVDLRIFLDELACVVRARIDPARSPIFVVSIDDADMNPGRSGELVELIRTFYHPRLVFLVTGESRLFVSALQRHLEGAIGEQVRRLPNTAILPDTSSSMTALAADLYDRTFPLHHRIRLPELTAIERWPAIAPGGPRDAHTPACRLRAAVEILRHPSLGEASAPLGQYLDPIAGGQPRLHHALPARIRRLTHLADELRANPPATSHELVARLWKQCVEQAPLGPDTRAHLQDWIQMVQTLAGEALRVALPTRVSRSSRTESVRQYPHLGADHETSIDVRRLTGLILRVGTGDGLRLGPEITDTLLLAVDVAGERPDGVEGWLPIEMPLVVSIRRQAPPRVVWPLPRWQRWLPYQRFATLWDRWLMGTPGPRLEDLPRMFISGCLAASSPPASGDNGPWLDSHPAEPLDWATLRTRLAEAGASSGPYSPDGTPLAEWASGPGFLVLAPECGLPAQTCKQGLEGLFGKDSIPEEQYRRVSEARTALLEEVLPHAPGRAQHMARQQQHPWNERFSEVKSRPTATSRATPTLEGLWRTVRVPHSSAQYLPQAQTLADYLGTSQRQAWVQIANRLVRKQYGRLAATFPETPSELELLTSHLWQLFGRLAPSAFRPEPLPGQKILWHRAKERWIPWFLKDRVEPLGEADAFGALLYAVACDVELDVVAPLQPVTNTRPWDREGDRRWDVPWFPAPLDRELLDDAWDTWCKPEDDPDERAFRLCWSVWSVAESRTIPRAPPQRSQQTWTTLLDEQIFKQRSHEDEWGSSWRWIAWNTWRTTALPRLAAPEARLSTETATILLEWFKAHDRLTDDSMRRLQELRQVDLASKLRAFDAEVTHPWNVQVRSTLGP